jgi:hypothetical protein
MLTNLLQFLADASWESAGVRGAADALIGLLPDIMDNPLVGDVSVSVRRACALAVRRICPGALVCFCLQPSHSQPWFSMWLFQQGRDGAEVMRQQLG